jgi:hypothetical protein
MRVVESGRDEAAAQVHGARRGPDVTPYLRVRTHGQDGVAGQRQGLRARPRRIRRPDPSVQEHAIGRRQRGRRRGCHRRQGGERRGQDAQPGDHGQGF